MAKTVQIPEELFVDLCFWHMLDGQTQEREARIKAGLDDKLEALRKRELYSRYKSGDEKARDEYLELIGLRDSFKW